MDTEFSQSSHAHPRKDKRLRKNEVWSPTFWVANPKLPRCPRVGVEGAIMNNIYEDDFEKQLEKLDKEKPVAVYCKVGGRSGQAMGKMNKLGFKEVYNLDGGMDAWKSAGKPTVKP